MTVSTLLALHFNLSAKQNPYTEAKQKTMKKILFANAVGCLIYAMVFTTPDLAKAWAWYPNIGKFRECLLVSCQIDNNIPEGHKHQRYHVRGTTRGTQTSVVSWLHQL